MNSLGVDEVHVVLLMIADHRMLVYLLGMTIAFQIHYHHLQNIHQSSIKCKTIIV